MTNNSNIETEYKKLNASNAWPVIYQHIRQESSKYDYKCLEAAKPQNKNLNRYRDVSPFDHSRIVLKKGPCDYINANLIKVARANRSYILTQGPLAFTVGHFWLMVWEQKSLAVIMLNKLVEKRQVKCHWYWPQEIGTDHLVSLDEVGLTVEYIEHTDHSYYSTRILRLTDIISKESRDILQFHYTTWPDFGVPTSPTAFLEFLRKVRESGALEENVGPCVIHCSAGIGRSGTFCLVDSCLVMIEKFGTNEVDVKEVLLEMRRYRMGLIQTPDQLRFSYQAIIEGAKRLSQNSLSEMENSNLALSISSDSIEEEEVPVHSSEEDEPPPLPPPRLDSLQPRPPVDRPLPNIPNSASLNDFNSTCSSSYPTEDGDVPAGDSPPSRPLPVAPAHDEDDDHLVADEQEEPNESNDINNSTSPAAELRHRKRQERKEAMAEKVREMKRRQQSVEKWQQLKRSLYKPIVIAGALAFGGGCLVAYIYYYRA